MLTFCLLFLRFGWLRLCRRPVTLAERALWMSASCALVLRRLGISVSTEGREPAPGLIVSNHLGYLDILVHAAAGPRIFVSKSDVRAWPIVGLLASCGGTIFIQRGNRASATATAIEMEYALRQGITVVLFPEGTSTDGSTLLPFHSFLFEPAIEAESAVTASAISYEADEASEGDLCYYGDVRFVPHLLETMGRKSVRAKLRFDAKPRIYASRKLAANESWERVARLRLYSDIDSSPEPQWKASLAGGRR